jgi:hypothetical protein
VVNICYESKREETFLNTPRFWQYGGANAVLQADNKVHLRSGIARDDNKSLQA